MDIVDMTCVAALLRVRWQCIATPFQCVSVLIFPVIEADYTTAITLLTRFKLPPSKEGPRSLVKDACFLSKNKTPEGGASVVQYYSGQRPRIPGPDEEKPYSPLLSQQKQGGKRWANPRSSPSPSPARFATPQKQLENLFSEVSGTLQRRTEGWSVSKAVRGAVGEVKRNVNNFQTGHSREASVDGGGRSIEEHQLLRKQLEMHEKRNKALSKMLDGAMMSLRTCKITNGTNSTETEDVFNMALAKIQFVSVYLADSDIPIPQDAESDRIQEEKPQEERPQEEKPKEENPKEETPREETTQRKSAVPEIQEPNTSTPQLVTKKGAPRLIETRADKDVQAVTSSKNASSSKKHQARPSLSDSSFSFMLGENRHRSSFVSSVTDPPEQRRGSDAQEIPKKLWDDAKNNKDGKATKRTDDGFTMNSWRQ